MCQPWLGSWMITVRHALRLVSQGLFAMRADLAVFHCRLLGHEAARWNSVLQWGGLEGTASHGGTPPTSRQCCGFSLLVPQAGWCRLFQSRQEARCGAWGQARRVLISTAVFRQGNLAGLTHQWKADRATCTPSRGKRFQLWGPPRVVCKKEGVGVLAVQTYAVVAPWVPGTYRALYEMVPARAELHWQLEVSHSSLWMLLDYHGDGFPLLNAVGFCGTQGMENALIVLGII